MVRESTGAIDAGAVHRRLEASADDLIVDTPADVLLPRPTTIRPPRILIGRLVHHPKGIDESGGAEYLVHPRPLLRQKPGILLIRAPIPQIDRLVGDVPVTADDVVAPARRELLETLQKPIHKTIFELLSHVAGGPGGGVQRNHADFSKSRF